jgi:hypothetical protein
MTPKGGGTFSRYPEIVPAAWNRKNLSLASIVSGALLLAAIIGVAIYLGTSRPEAVQNGPASAEARAYVSKLTLSDVRMTASENFMKQQVVEIDGKITNDGQRPLQSVDVYCVFRGVDGREIYRERTPIVRSKGVPLRPKETRPFRLAFDSLPDGWNQALPTLVVAQITFTH